MLAACREIGGARLVFSDSTARVFFLPPQRFSVQPRCIEPLSLNNKIAQKAMCLKHRSNYRGEKWPNSLQMRLARKPCGQMARRGRERRRGLEEGVVVREGGRGARERIRR